MINRTAQDRKLLLPGVPLHDSKWRFPEGLTLVEVILPGLYGMLDVEMSWFAVNKRMLGKENTMASLLRKAVSMKSVSLEALLKSLNICDDQDAVKLWGHRQELQKSAKSNVALAEYASTWGQKTAISTPGMNLDFADFIARCECHANYASCYIYPRNEKEEARCYALGENEWQFFDCD